MLLVEAAGCGAGGDDGRNAATNVPPRAVAAVGEAGVPAARYERALGARVRGVSPLTGGTGAAATPLDPPRYTKCVAALRAQDRRAARAAPEDNRPPPPAAEQLVANCRALMLTARRATEGELIQGEWIRQEAADQEVRVTPAETTTALDQFVFASAQRDGRKPVPAAKARARFDRRLARSGLTREDVLLQLRTQLLQQRLLEKLTRERGDGKPLGTAVAQRLQIEFQNDLQRDWRPRTLCAPRYVVQQCRNGPALPDLPLPR